MKNARRTAFHAAVQYYCRQLGITAYESALPLVYLDSVAQLDTPAVSETEHGFRDHLHGTEGTTKGFLGFTPPDHRSSQLLRAKARKGKSRKVLRGIGAGGGDN